MIDNNSYQFKLLLEDESSKENSREFLSGRMNQFLCTVGKWDKTFQLKLTPRFLDLLRIAAAIYVTDRINPRDHVHADFGWSRSPRIQIKVFDFEFWSSQEVMDSLHCCLDFLSGDQWDISFLPASLEFDSGFLPFSRNWRPLKGNPVICLYSGGLDSTAGLVRYMNHNDSRDIVPLLVRHSGQGKLVKEQIKTINRVMNTKLIPRILPFWMRTPEKLGFREEDTQRTRSFLFCSAAAVVATMVEARVIKMMEGGIGAINLPLMSGMVGSKATRSCHPTFLRRFSNLLQLVTNRDLAVELPHRFLTKAELTKSLVEVGLHELALDTVSCVHYPFRDPKFKECGICPACIFRRQALFCAGIDESGSKYQYDLFSAASSEKIPKEKLNPLRAFLMQIDKLSQLENSSQLPTFFVRHLRATEVISSDSVPSEIVDLYRRYRKEWLNLIAKGQHQGWKWTQMMSPFLINS